MEIPQQGSNETAVPDSSSASWPDRSPLAMLGIYLRGLFMSAAVTVPAVPAVSGGTGRSGRLPRGRPG